MANPLIYSLFLSKYFGAWEGVTSDLDFAPVVVEKQGAKDIRYNALYTQGFERLISTPTTEVLTLVGSRTLSDRVVMVAEIIGDGAIKVTGLDTDGTTPITANLRGVGTEKFPARVLYGGRYFTNITLIPNEENVKFRLKLVVVCAAGDARYSL